jgi:hypothetical protein
VGTRGREYYGAADGVSKDDCVGELATADVLTWCACLVVRVCVVSRITFCMVLYVLSVGGCIERTYRENVLVVSNKHVEQTCRSSLVNECG